MENSNKPWDLGIPMDSLFLDKHICVNLSLPVAVFRFLITQLGRESSIRFYRGLLV